MTTRLWVINLSTSRVRNGSGKRDGHQMTVNEILPKKDISENVYFFTKFVSEFLRFPGYIANVAGNFAMKPEIAYTQDHTRNHTQNKLLWSSQYRGCW